VCDVRENAFGTAALVEVIMRESDAQRRIADVPSPRPGTDQLICDLPLGMMNATVNFCK
jgi:hypothetical protein